MKALILCLQFLTKLPLPFVIKGEDDLFARGMKYFPVAGLLIGIIDAIAGFLVLQVFSVWTAALAILICDTLMTGALHIDGLADTCDSFSSHRDRKTMLEIMKDSRIGTFGVTGVLLVFSVKLLMYYEYLSAARGFVRFGLLIAVPVVSRWIMAVLIYGSDYARKEGMGGLFFAYKNSMNLPVTCVLGMILSLTALFYAPLLWICALVTGFAFRRICYQKIGGMTGDTLGASLEWMETVMLIAAAAAASLI